MTDEVCRSFMTAADIELSHGKGAVLNSSVAYTGRVRSRYIELSQGKGAVLNSSVANTGRSRSMTSMDIELSHIFPRQGLNHATLFLSRVTIHGLTHIFF